MNYLKSIVIFFFLASASFASDAPASPDKNLRCAVCGMFVAPYADWNAKIEFADSASVVFDGTKDMFKYYLDMKKYDPAKDRAKVVSVTVKDYASKKDTDAFKAWYVVWSDVYGPMGNEPISFKTKAAARKFLQEHHGKKILRFSDITLKIIYELDNPE